MVIATAALATAAALFVALWSPSGGAAASSSSAAAARKHLAPFATGVEPPPAPVAATPDPRYGKLRELPGERGPNLRTFRTAKGDMVARVYPVNVNYKDAKGRWQPIDNRLIASSSSGAAFENKANSYRALLPANLSQPVRYEHGGRWVSFALKGASAPGSSSGDSASYGNALPSTSVKYTTLSRALKESLVLRDANAPDHFDYAFDASSGLTPREAADGSIAFIDGGGVSRFTFRAPFMRDAKGAVSSQVKLKLLSDGRTVRLTPDAAWLKSSDRSWPVDVDPDTYWDSSGTQTTLHSEPYQDTYIQAGSAQDTNFADQPTADVGGADTARSLLYFDFQYYLDKDVHIISAQLSLHLDSRDGSASEPVAVHSLSHDWVIGDTTWNESSAGTPWSTPGGDYDSSALDTQDVGAAGQRYEWSLPRDVVEGWNHSPDTYANRTNWGVLLKADETGSPDLLHFASADSANPDDVPYLDVLYTPHTGIRNAFTFQPMRLDDHTEAAINVANGNLVVHNSDIHIPGVAGMDLNVDRYYNSQLLLDNTGIGANWEFSFGQDVHVDYTRAGEAIYHAPTGAVIAMQKEAASDQTDSSGTLYKADSEPGLELLHKTSDNTSKLTDHRNGHVIVFHSSDLDGYEESETDRNGNTITYHYDSTSGRLDHITDTRNHELDFSYDSASGNVAEISDWTGRHWQYAYVQDRDGEWLLHTYTDPEGGVTEYAYNPGWRTLDAIASPEYRSIVFDWYGYSVTGTSFITDTDNWTGPGPDFSYQDPGSDCPDTDDDGHTLGQTVVTDGNGHDTRYCWDANDRVLRSFDQDGHKTSKHYTSSDQVDQYTDASGDLTKVGYDNGRVSSLTQPPDAGSGDQPAVSTFTYSSDPKDFNPDSFRSADDKNLDFGYTSNGNLKTTQGDDGNPNDPGPQVTIDYNDGGSGETDNGTIKSSTDGDGNQTSYSYDSDANLTGIDYPSGSGLGSVKLHPDSLGRVDWVRDGKDNKQAFTYDRLDRVKTVSFYHCTAHDSDGNCTTDALDGSFTYCYDGDGNRTSRIEKDAAGATVAETDYTFDRRNLLTEIDYPGSRWVAETYDDNENLTSTTTDDGHQVAYTYTPTNLVQTAQENNVDGSGNVTPAVPSPTTFVYDNKKRRTETEFPNGVTQHVDYDSAGRPKRIWADDGSNTLTDFHYSFIHNDGSGDTEGNLLREMIDERRGQTTDYQYDLLGRLKDVNDSAGPSPDHFTYEFDNASNITRRTHNSSDVTNYGYNSGNELCWRTSTDPVSDHNCDSGSEPTGSTTYQYDANGALTGSSDGLSIDYNSRGQTTSIDPNGGGGTTFGYAGMGQSERNSAGGTSFTYSVLGLDRQADGSSTSYFLRDDTGQPYGEVVGSDRYYYLSDLLGSTVALTDSSGNAATRYVYKDPYGTDPDIGGDTTIPNPYRYAGGYLDTATGYYKLGARYYIPDLGRFTQKDPLNQAFDPRQQNGYAYTGGDPANFTDPSGMCFVVSCSTYDSIGNGLSSAYNYLTSETGQQIGDFAAGCVSGGELGTFYGTALAAPEVGAGVGCVAGGFTAAEAGGNALESTPSPESAK